MLIGVPKEIKDRENRIGVVPGDADHRMIFRLAEVGPLPVLAADPDKIVVDERHVINAAGVLGGRPGSADEPGEVKAGEGEGAQ